MNQTIEAVVDETGKISFLTEVHLEKSCRALVTILDEEPRLKEEFEDLVESWKKATFHLSYTTQKITHRNYLRIIGMGEKVLSLIFEELNERPSGSWFPALEAISGINAAQDAKSIDDAVDMWLKWGKNHQYI